MQYLSLALSSLKLPVMPALSKEIIIIIMTFSYVISEFHGNFSLFMRSSGNANFKSRLNDAILIQN